MEERRLWMLFFETGRPEVYLQICSRRRLHREREAQQGQSKPAFRPVQEEKRLV